MTADVLRFPASFTLEEYLRREEVGEMKSQLIRGRMVAMSGGSKWHNFAQMQMMFRLSEHLRGSRCKVLGSLVKIYISATREVFYPDVSVASPPHWINEESGLYDNPKLIVEVLSPSTRKRDRTTKLYAYQTLESLEEYLILDPKIRTAEVYSREAGWVREDAPETLRLRSVALELPVAELFDPEEMK